MLLALVVALALAAPQAATSSKVRVVTETFADGKTQREYEVLDVKGVATKHGAFKEWRADGSLAAEGRFDKGLESGSWTYYDAGGKPSESGRCAKGERVGTWTETWPDGAFKTAGGVHNWSELTVDEQNGIVFIPTGTGRFDFYGGNRHGANLFANSLVALDAKTGRRLWHQQLVHHDLWDFDLPQAPKLLTLRQNGRTIEAVAQATKMALGERSDRVVIRHSTFDGAVTIYGREGRDSLDAGLKSTPLGAALDNVFASRPRRFGIERLLS